MQKDTIVKTSSFLRAKKILERIRIRLENHFFTTWKQRNRSCDRKRPSCATEILSKNEKLGRKFPDTFWNFLLKMFPVSRLVSQIMKSHLCSQNFWFLVKLEGCSITNWNKSRIVSEKIRSSKKLQIVLKKILMDIYPGNLTSDKQM